MDRHHQQQSPDALGALGTLANGRSGLPRFAGRFTSRKPYQTRREREANEDAVTAPTPNATSNQPNRLGAGSPSPSTTSSSASSRVSSPVPRTRIPRPSSSQGGNFSSSRRSLPLTDAYRMAETEDHPFPGSPSPAPRLLRAPSSADENGLQAILKQRPLNFGRRRSSRQSEGSVRDDESLVSSASGEERFSPAGREPMPPARDRERIENVTRPGNGLFSKAKVGPKVAETGKELHRKASNSSLNGSSPVGGSRYRGPLGKTDPNFGQRLAPPTDYSGKDALVPSIEAGTPGVAAGHREMRSTTSSLPIRSPNKSVAWEADADFTAGDLQVSASPPVKVAQKSKLEELKAFRPRNTKLDDIRRREIEAVKNIPLDPPPPTADQEVDDILAEDAADDRQSFAKRRLSGRSNTRIDEIRAREIESLSRRALATARLDEIRERNSESRSLSPEIGRKSSREPLRDSSPGPSGDDTERATERTIAEGEGERIPDTPVVVYRGSTSDRERRSATSQSEGASRDDKDDREPHRSRGVQSHSRGDSQDLLRQLARAASNSPSLEQQQQALKDQRKRDEEAKKNLFDGPAPQKDKASEGKRDKRSEAPQPRQLDPVKALIGSSGLRRVGSSDSDPTSSKRSSVANSETDPTDRIAAEMLLFAPLENHSEKGSIRAPSPGPDSDVDSDEQVEETPRPARQQDPLVLPTPKVTGAYVDTPATIKVEKPEEVRTHPRTAAALGAASLLRSRGRPKSALSVGKPDEDAPSGRSSSVAIRRRARSLPRTRSPLINSVKLPSAKDDLLEIHRRHQSQDMDDSTLDDFGGLLPDSPTLDSTTELDLVSSKMEAKAKAAAAPKAEDKPAIISSRTDQDADQDPEDDDKARVKRIGEKVEAVFLGIRSAKQGIARLEDRVSQVGLESETKAKAARSSPEHSHSHSAHHHHHHHGDPNTSAAADCPICVAQLKPKPTVTYVHLPVPRLYHRQPRFRLSVLGVLLLLLALWLASESAMCARFCRPTTCGPGDDCSWSPDDPLFFGHAIPVKLDQWATGGKVRVLAERLSREAGDLLAEAWDYVAQRDLLAADTAGMSFEERRRHRRRLRRRGLIAPWVPPPGQKANMEAWARARRERERVDALREMGYDVGVGDGLGEDESMDGDERVSSSSV